LCFQNLFLATFLLEEMILIAFDGAIAIISFPEVIDLIEAKHINKPCQGGREEGSQYYLLPGTCLLP